MTFKAFICFLLRFLCFAGKRSGVSGLETPNDHRFPLRRSGFCRLYVHHFTFLSELELLLCLSMLPVQIYYFELYLMCF
ncbi:hypothetical protein K1719_044872 [Acacia pycnantha]|nr:hypothetical protein K1719_044872 [Acacia pycnantha]